MKKFKFEEIQEDHSEEIFTLQKRNSSDFEGNIWKTLELKKLIKKKDFKGKVFKEKKRIYGFCFFRRIDDYIEIYSIFVDPMFRKKGIANHLMKHCINYCKTNHLKKIIIDVNEVNFQAINFYRKNNFIFCGRRKNYYTNSGQANDSYSMHLTF